MSSTNRNLEDTKEKFHVARLTRFNITLLNSLEIENIKEVQQLIKSEAMNNRLSEPVPLLHQGTFLSLSYICLVWVWESVKKSNLKGRLLQEFERTVSRYPLQFPAKQQVHGERNIYDWEGVLTLIRNALSHSRVEIDDEYFVFSDQNKSGKNKEISETSLRLAWKDLGLLCECVILALGPLLDPPT